MIEALGVPPVADRRTELVERKGIGHPDTICDALVEAASVALNRLYLERLGTIPHYNIDKALLIAGQCRKDFARGRLTRPMELVVGDRATMSVDGRDLPVAEVVRTAVTDWTRAYLPRVPMPEGLRVRVALAPGSAELTGLFAGPAPAGANDTGGACGYAPLTPTEQLVLDIEGYLNGPDFKARFPDTGQDVKVFAARRDARVEVTVAMPLGCLETRSERDYFARKEAILAALAERFPSGPLELAWSLNSLDRPGRGAAGTYLTLTGTSAEDADSGQVGRGNRANGLIAFARPTGGEAAAGKNPVLHIGKVYSVWSHLMARRIHAACPELPEVYVHLAARIGDPVDRPWIAVQVVLAAGMALGDVERPIADTVERELARLPELRQALLRGEHPVC